MANIGTLAVNVVARTGKFIAGMQTARKSLNNFAMQAKTAAMSTAGFASGLLAVGAGAGLATLISNSMESIDATAKLSDRLNIATEDLIAFQHAGELAGITTESFTKGIEKFVRNIGDVRAGSGQAARSFEILGLSADSLANMDTGEALGMVADQINKLPTAADKAAAATALFGRAGGDMLNLLAGGSAGLEAAKQKMEELGLSFSRLDAAKVEQANDAITDMKASFMGAFQTLAIEFSPAITAATEEITKFVASGDGIKSFSPTLEKTASAFGTIADVLDVFGDTFHAVQAGITQDLAMIMAEVARLAKQLQFVVNLMPGMEAQFGSDLQAMADSLDQLATTQWEEAKASFMEAPPSEGLNKFVNNAVDGANKIAAAMTDAKSPVEDFMGAFEANETADDLVAKLQEQVDWFGFSAEEMALWKVAASSADQETIDLAFALTEQKSALEAAAAATEKSRSEMEAMASEGASLMESLRTPQEQFDKQLDDLFRLKDVGAIDQMTFDRAAAKAGMDFADSVTMPTVPNGAAAIDARSAEGISRLRNQNKDPMKDALKVAEKQLAEQTIHRTYLAGILKNTAPDKLVGVSIP